MALKKAVVLLSNQGIVVLAITRLLLPHFLAAGVEPKDSFSKTNATPNKTIKLVENIRRQLMADNEDYFPSESSDDSMPTVRTEIDDGNDYRKHNNDTDGSYDDLIHQMQPPNNDKQDEIRPDRGLIVSRKDLLYYIDDKRMRRMNYESNNDVNDTTSEESEDDFDDMADTAKLKAKYKVIKVKEDHPTRRDTPNRRQLPYRRFIQESNRDGVAIIRLDDGPFPVFQLPRGRRQYMGGSDDDDGSMLSAAGSS